MADNKSAIEKAAEKAGVSVETAKANAEQVLKEATGGKYNPPEDKK